MRRRLAGPLTLPLALSAPRLSRNRIGTFVSFRSATAISLGIQCAHPYPSDTLMVIGTMSLGRARHQSGDIDRWQSTRDEQTRGGLDRILLFASAFERHAIVFYSHHIDCIYSYSLCTSRVSHVKFNFYLLIYQIFSKLVRKIANKVDYSVVVEKQKEKTNRFKEKRIDMSE